MTKRLLVTSRAAVAIVATMVIVACKRETVPACLTPSASAECFAADFYTWYTTPRSKGGPEANAREAMRLREGSFSPALLSAIASDTGTVRLPFDPFLHSQTPCEVPDAEAKRDRGGIPDGQHVQVHQFPLR
jgi:hypothetical protein